MRISTRMTAALAVAAVLVFGGYGARVLVEERRSLDLAVRREVLLLGTSLRVAVENALRDRQLADVDETVLRLEQIDHTVDVFLFDRDGQRLASPASPATGGIPEAALDQLVRTVLTTGEPTVEITPPGAERAALVGVPLSADDGGIVGALGIVRPLDDVFADLEATRRSVALWVALFVVLASVLGLGLGTVYIGRPLERLAAGMRRVRQGDLETGLGATADDEIGAVAREFDVMLAELREARRRLRDEELRRRALLRAVQEQDKLVTIGQLAAALAHEVGSPLQVLHGRASALARRADDPVNVQRQAEIMVVETERVTRIVDRLLSIARRPAPEVTDVDIAATIEDVVEVLEIEARRRGVDLTADTAAAVYVRADRDQLRQVLMNLLTNALAATPTGGRVSVAAHDAPGLVRIVVADTGAGMAEAIRAQVFEPFFTTRALEGGRGLGLAVVHAIVSDHGGAIRIDSARGTGTRVTVELPTNGATP